MTNNGSSVVICSNNQTDAYFGYNEENRLLGKDDHVWNNERKMEKKKTKIMHLDVEF